MLKFRLGLCVLLALGLMAGCSQPNPSAPGRISGQVTLNGSPLPGGNITFHSDGKGTYRSPIGSDGTYEVTDMPTGSMAVTVETESINPANKPPAYTGSGGKMDKMAAERMAAEKRQGASVKSSSGQYKRIPTKYTNPKTSPLTVTIEAGRQVKEFELTGKD